MRDIDKNFTENCIKFKKPRYCANARASVSVGDFVNYYEGYKIGNLTTHGEVNIGKAFGRVVGLAKRDGLGNEYKKDVFIVLRLDDSLATVYLRHVEVEDVLRVVPPRRDSGAFIKWFMFGSLEDTKILEDMYSHGSLNVHYFDRYVNEKGELDAKTWRAKNG